MTLLFIEIIIAKFVHDDFVRPYIGDVLVVILIYCFIKSFLKINNTKIAIAVLLFSYTIEMLQYFKLVKLLGLEDIKMARIIIGTSFSWLDMLCYTVGIVLVLLFEKKLNLLFLKILVMYILFIMFIHSAIFIKIKSYIITI